MSDSSVHPDELKLIAFGLGRLADGESSVIESHLSVCSACRQAVENAPADSLVQLLKDAHTLADADPAADTPPLAASEAPASLPPLYKKVANILGQTSPLIQTSDPTATPAGLPRDLAGHPRYEVLEQLGAGGMGTVYRARHRLMSRDVALKVINPVLVNRPGAVERFTREVKAAAQLVHPNIVTAFDAEKVGDLHLLVMEHVEGQTLAQHLFQEGALPVSRACDFIRQAAVGLQHALEQGMVHRDIKPHNLMVTSRGQVKILDFGLARFVSETDLGGGTTEHGSLMGSPDYMAPEQAHDAHSADARADIYSLGCTLFQLLTGQLPFPARTLLEKLEAHRDQPPPSIRTIRPDVSIGLAQVLERMLAKDPARRYQTPGEVAVALTPFASENATPPPQPATPRRPRSFVWPVVALAVIAALAFGGVMLAPLILRIETEAGTLQVTADDRDVEIQVSDGGKKVTVLDLKSKTRFELPVGEYTAQLSRGKEGLKLSASKFSIRRGADEVLKVEFEPRVQAKAAAEPAPPNKADVKMPPVTPPSKAATLPTEKNPLERAREHLAKRELDEALKMCEAIVNREAMNVDARLLRADVHIARGRFDLAAVDYTAILKQDPGHGKALSGRAYSHLNTNRPEGAIADADEYLRRYPDGPDAWAAYANRGGAYGWMGRFERARDDFSRAVECDGKYAFGYLWRSMMQARLGEPLAARADRAQALKLDPNFATYPMNSLDDVAPRPAPLDEWLQGRTILTVSQDGRGKFRTIQAALDALQAGQAIEVLDRGPYRERLDRRNLPDDVGLFSRVGTRVEFPDWNKGSIAKSGKFHYGGLYLHGAKGFRLHELEIVAPAAPADAEVAYVLHLECHGDVVVEACGMLHSPRYPTTAPPAANDPEYPYFDSLILGQPVQPKARYFIHENRLEGRLFFLPLLVRVAVVRNNHLIGWRNNAMILPTRVGEMVIDHNVMQGSLGIHLPCRTTATSKDTPVVSTLRIANNFIDVGGLPIATDLGGNWQPFANVRIHGNILRSAQHFGIAIRKDEMDYVTKNWKVTHNHYATDPKTLDGSASIPVGATDTVLPDLTEHFRSLDLANPASLRPIEDSPLATGGAGGSLPSHAGPLPPGAAPTQGDWWTRLVAAERSRPSEPTSSQWFARARIARERQLWEQAASFASSALRGDPENLDMTLFRGEMMNHLQRWKEGEEDFSAVLRKRPDDGRALGGRSYIARHTDRPEQCIADATAVIKRHQDAKLVARALADRNWAFATKGRFAEAIADCDRVHELDPKWAFILRDRAFLHERIGNLDAAKADFERAVKLDPKAVRHENPYTKVVPQSEPLADWLRGRKLVTVAQKGLADHRTIQAALDALKAGECIKILDRGPYREKLEKQLPEDVGIVSDVGTRLELSEWTPLGPADPKERRWHYGHILRCKRGLRLAGLEIVPPEFPENWLGGRPLDIHAAGPMVVENCRVLRTPRVSHEPPEESEDRHVFISAMHITSYGLNAASDVHLRHNFLEMGVEVHSIWGAVVVEENVITSWRWRGLAVTMQGGEVLVRRNVIRAETGVTLFSLHGPKSSGARPTGLEVTNNVLDVLGPPIAMRPDPPLERASAPGHFRVRNNILISRARAGVSFVQVDGDHGKLSEIGPNVYGSEPAGDLPRRPNDRIVERPFLSLDPRDPGYYRIAADSPLAKGGAGGDLPTYLGALPPGPTPAGGDWFSRLLKRP